MNPVLKVGRLLAGAVRSASKLAAYGETSFRKHSLCLILTLLSVLPLSAQEPSPASAPVRTFRILTVVGAITDLKYDLRPGRPGTPVVISAVPFAAYPIPGDNHLVLYREVPPPPAAPPGTPPTKVPVAEAQVSSNTPRVLVAIIPAASNHVTTVVVEDDPAKHPAGQLRVINLSALNAVVALDRRQYPLASGGSEQVAWGKGGVLVQVAAKKDGEWKIAFRKERLARAHARGYGVIFDYIPDPAMNEDPKSPPPATVHFFSENVPPPAP